MVDTARQWWKKQHRRNRMKVVPPHILSRPGCLPSDLPSSAVAGFVRREHYAWLDLAVWARERGADRCSVSHDRALANARVWRQSEHWRALP
jgi:hypothetical protein